MFVRHAILPFTQTWQVEMNNGMFERLFYNVTSEIMVHL